MTNHPIFKDYHPADFYNKIMNDLSSAEAKALAKELNVPYKNKRIFAKELCKIKESNN